MTRDELLRVYQAELPRLRSLVRRRMGSASPDVDDVLQDVFLRAWLHCGMLREDSRCAGWLTRIAANTCVTYLRRSKRCMPCGELPATGTEDVDVRVVARLTVEDAMTRLSPAARQVVWLHALEGYPIKEVAHRMRRPESTVRSSLYRARKAMNALHPRGAEALLPSSVMSLSV